MNTLQFIVLETSKISHTLSHQLQRTCNSKMKFCCEQDPWLDWKRFIKGNWKLSNSYNKTEMVYFFIQSVACSVLNLIARKAYFGQIFGSARNQALHHCWWVLLGMFRQLNPQLTSFDSAVWHTAAALFLGENLHDGHGICPQASPLHHRLT